MEIKLRFAFSALKAINNWLMNFSEKMTFALMVSNYCDTFSPKILPEHFKLCLSIPERETSALKEIMRAAETMGFLD